MLSGIAFAQQPSENSSGPVIIQLPGATPYNGSTPQARRARQLLVWNTPQLQSDGTPTTPPLTLPSGALRSFFLAFPDSEQGRADRILAQALPRMELRGATNLLTDPQRRELAQSLRRALLSLPLPEPDALDRRASGADIITVTTNTAGAIRLSRTEEGLWIFPDETIQSLPSILAALEDEPRPVRDLAGSLGDPRALLHEKARSTLPEFMLMPFYGAAGWQWIILILLIFPGFWLIQKALKAILLRVLHFILYRWGQQLEQSLLQPSSASLALLLTAKFSYWVVETLHLPPRLTGLLTYALIILALYAVIISVWAVLEAVRQVLLMKQPTKLGGKSDEILITFIVRTIKIVLILIALAVAGHSLGFNITALVAGLGLGGVAFALAARNTIENIFGSITILVDRPFRIGDRIKINTMEGTVVKVGLRSTRITSSSGSVITLPNHQFINSTIENLGSNPPRTWSATLLLDVSNPPDRLNRFLEEAKALLANRSTVEPSSVTVRLTTLGPRAITLACNLKIRALDDASDFATRQELILGLNHLLASNEIQLAPPGT